MLLLFESPCCLSFNLTFAESGRSACSPPLGASFRMDKGTACDTVVVSIASTSVHCGATCGDAGRSPAFSPLLDPGHCACGRCILGKCGHAPLFHSWVCLLQTRAGYARTGQWNGSRRWRQWGERDIMARSSCRDA